MLDNHDLIESPDPAARRRIVALTIRWGRSTGPIWRVAQALADAEAAHRDQRSLQLWALPTGLQEHFLELAQRAIGEIDPAHRVAHAAAAVVETGDFFQALGDRPIVRDIAREAIARYEAIRCAPMPAVPR